MCYGPCEQQTCGKMAAAAAAAAARLQPKSDKFTKKKVISSIVDKIPFVRKEVIS
uniref:Uncharacterized protein n=1 Tax=Arundo donax TaxID=35708 RepID=A0A0A9A849_ARUDO